MPFRTPLKFYSAPSITPFWVYAIPFSHSPSLLTATAITHSGSPDPSRPASEPWPRSGRRYCRRSRCTAYRWHWMDEVQRFRRRACFRGKRGRLAWYRTDMRPTLRGGVARYNFMREYFTKLLRLCQVMVRVIKICWVILLGQVRENAGFLLGHGKFAGSFAGSRIPICGVTILHLLGHERAERGFY